MEPDSPSLSLRSAGSRLSGALTSDGESFYSATSLPCSHFLSANVINVVEKCMSSMQAGCQMVKLRGGSKGLVRFFYLDEHKSCIRWRPSRKNEKAKISIDSIREVCEGNQSEIFQRYADGSFDPNCCFSIYYGEHMESLDLVSGTGEEARTWITGLKYLMAGISDEDSLAKRQRTRDQWLKQTFTEADKNGDGSLSISEVLQLLHKLNVNLPRQKVKQMFKEADTDDNQGTLGFEEFCSFYKMMSTRRDLYLLMLTYGNHKDHLDTADLTRFMEVEQKMTKVTKEHCMEVVAKFEPCPDNQKQGVLGIDGFTNYMRSPEGDIFNQAHDEVVQDMSRPLCDYFIASSHNTYLMGDQLMSQSRVDMYAWVLQAGCRCVEVDCWDGQDGEPIVHHGYTLTSKILFKDVIETINKYAFVKNPYPVILSIENHCSIPQQKKMAQYLMEVLGDKLDLSSVTPNESGRLPSPEALKGKILVKGKKLPPNIDEDAEEGDVSDEDSADEMEDDCKLMNGDTSMSRKQVENVAKKKLDNLMKESKIRDREDPDSFTISALPPSGKKDKDKSPHKGKAEDSTDTTDEANSSTNKRMGRSFMGSFSKRKKKSTKLKKTSSFEDTDTDQESSSSASRAPLHHSRKKKTMKLSRALSDLVKYTKSVGMLDIEAQAASSSWQVSSLSETKGHQILQQKAAQFSHFNQRQLSRIYPSSYRVDSSNFNPQPFWNAGCHLVALNYQSEGRVLQLNRAKFKSNGNCGYILKPDCMCQGTFNPMVEDPLPGRMRKQLVLKIISGQQLPKPKDSMLGDRGEIIDPFVEVEVIGLPVDCCKEQTRVVDDNGFNPMWEETLVFTLSMPELALIRFLVWDHDPIGQDFIGQRTIAFNSMMPGYRHVYLEGMEEASIFVHIAVNDITGKARAASGIKSLFHRNPKQASLDSHAAALLSRKSPFGAHLLRRTASAPSKAPGAKAQAQGLPDLSTHPTKDCDPRGGEPGSPQPKQAAAGTAEGDLEVGAGASADGGTAPHPWGGTNGQLHPGDGKGLQHIQRYLSPHPALESISEELSDRLLSSSSSFTSSFSSSFTSSFSSSFTSSSTSAPSPVSPPPLTDQTSTPGPAADQQITHPPLQKTPPLPAPSPPHPETSPGSSQGRSEPLDTPVTPPLPSGSMQPPAAAEDHGEADSESSSPRQGVHALRALFDRDPPQQAPGLAPRANKLAHTPVRRTKSEGQVRHGAAAAPSSSSLPTATPEVVMDATIGDRLWSTLDYTSHRDSVSSSSSISSNDTVIDLSLPNLASRSHRPSSGPATSSFPLRGPPHAGPPAAAHRDTPRPVSKSKSNPNLRQDELDELDELKPRPLSKEPRSSPAPALMQRRHTWSRLYMEGLKQAAVAKATARGSNHKIPPTPPPKPGELEAKSKSLGDLTSDDIACHFDSKYRSISRSFLCRPPPRDQRRLGLGGGGLAKPRDALTEQLKRLTDVEPLTSSDFSPRPAGAPPQPWHGSPEAGAEDWEQPPPLRRMSSRSQSRVRYIANRAKQAQERQRLQGMLGRPAAGGASVAGGPLEERGNPEGACTVARSPCSSLDLLSQLPPAPLPENLHNQHSHQNQTQNQLGPQDNGVFFRLKL
ncbi:1-phosphatidylinositol 4,5-bisphosphate phosphodiesterase eta-2a isoform X2 [Alosa sapidissima]|uniref:1-phosphatidylinositol 4,5-bisphosphate phosphodiesterase eta-2a isoform X2 n=1 Tax=Alosa sapidissima TaxID=34773 RepID=UPI001C0A2510|nr:1-phosphatidylinositol 4,5-bisphosphate phosphodiesterase eta-2a isoform X2 [Alosa sapidissima]